jgi:Leucine-rich repeat (LRR) protein
VAVAGLVGFLVLPGSPGPPETAGEAGEGSADVVVDERTDLRTPAGRSEARLVDALSKLAVAAAQPEPLVVDYPPEGAVFPPGMVPPTFLWRDGSPAADAWLVDLALDGGERHVRVFTRGESPPRGELDPTCVARTNQVHRPTPQQASARSWTPAPEVWATVQQHSRERPATITVTGFRRQQPDRVLSRGSTRFLTSADPLGAVIFYRDVPLVPWAGGQGVVSPLEPEVAAGVAWRVRDISRPESRVVMQGMVACAGCHAFSRDGRTVGLTLQGLNEDVGTLGLAPVSRHVVMRPDHLVSWNSLKDRPRGQRTAGLLPQLSADGQWAVATVKEELFVANYPDFRFLYAAFPTRGVLAVASRATGQVRLLPGADNPAYVHTGATWTPDGKELVFSRATAREAYVPDRPLPTRALDPEETPIQYDLYRIPFQGGRGGEASPITGASGNDASNTFPRVSPDGKWVVFTRTANGQGLRPDSELWIVPLAGGEARRMTCNTARMNSWHSFSPNGRWMVFAAKGDSPYTRLYLTHVDEHGQDTPPVLVPHTTAANRAANLPELVSLPPGALQSLDVPSNQDRKTVLRAADLLDQGQVEDAVELLREATRVASDNLGAHKLLGDVLRDRGQLDLARRAYDAALRVAPEDPDVVARLAAVALAEGNRREAEALLLDLSRMGAPHALGQVGLGRALNTRADVDLAVLAGLPLTSLDLSDVRASHLGPLRGMPLTRLVLSRAPVSDLSPLKATPLRSLSVDRTAVADLGPLTGLPLKSLDASSTPVTDIVPLRGMRLEHLHLGSTGVTDLSALSGMPLRVLGLSHTRVADLSALEGMPLQELFLSETQASQLDSLSRLPLTDLDVSYTVVQDLSPLAGLPLRTLDLIGTQVESLAALRGMALEELYVHETQVADLSPLAGMPLKVLGAHHTRVVDLTALGDMQLTRLSLAATDVTDLTPLAGMPLLRLNVEGTRVTDITPLTGMPLRDLFLSGTGVADLSPLRGMALRRLSLAGTRVTDLTPLAGMPLEEVVFTPGRVVRGLEVLRGMGSLRSVGTGRETPTMPPEAFWRLVDAAKPGGPASEPSLAPSSRP